MPPVYELPPFVCQEVATPLAETPDWWFDLLGLAAVHKLAKGKGVRVGVADTGIDETHPDLASAIRDARDFTRSRIGPRDAVKHGTWCAGAIASRINNVGIIGVAPECELLIAKVLGDGGSGTNQGIADGVDWLREGGCQVISMSLGGPYPDTCLQGALQRCANAGVFVIAAAGNSGPNSPPNYPAAWNDLCVAVAAVNRDGRLAEFSSRGPYVDIACYGQDVLSTVPGGGYARMSGTSMATPLVAGVAACLIQRHNELGAASKTPLETTGQLIEHLRRGAKDAGDPGKDTGYGWGLIDPGSVLAAEAAPTPGPVPAPALPPGTYEFRVGAYVFHTPAVAGDTLSVRLAG